MAQIISFPAAKRIASATFSYQAKTSWPEVNIKAGDWYSIKPGPTYKGQLVLVQCDDCVIFSFLIHRDVFGNIVVSGRTRTLFFFRRGQYRILGAVLREMM
jgi:hypothetical protein